MILCILGVLADFKFVFFFLVQPSPMLPKVEIKGADVGVILLPLAEDMEGQRNEFLYRWSEAAAAGLQRMVFIFDSFKFQWRSRV